METPRAWAGSIGWTRRGRRSKVEGPLREPPSHGDCDGLRRINLGSQDISQRFLHEISESHEPSSHSSQFLPFSNLATHSTARLESSLIMNGALKPTHQAPPMTKEDVESVMATLPLHARAACWLARKTASRWGDVANLTYECFNKNKHFPYLSAAKGFP